MSSSQKPAINEICPVCSGFRTMIALNRLKCMSSPECKAAILEETERLSSAGQAATGVLLKPCPFCGSRDVRYFPPSMSDGPPRVMCCADDCGADIEADHEEWVRSRWNRRP